MSWGNEGSPESWDRKNFVGAENRAKTKPNREISPSRRETKSVSALLGEQTWDRSPGHGKNCRAEEPRAQHQLKNQLKTKITMRDQALNHERKSQNQIRTRAGKTHELETQAQRAPGRKKPKWPAPGSRLERDLSSVIHEQDF
jgi:hypothetical protein